MNPSNHKEVKEEEIKHVPKLDIDENNYKKTINCIHPDASSVAELDGFHVSVAKYEKKPGGLFS